MRLFVYGTLLEGLAHGEAARLMEGIGVGIDATVSGELRLVVQELGCYPILVPGEGRVSGRIFDCPDDPQWLADLDAYEGQDYRRWTVVAMLDDGTEAETQAFICILPDADEFEPIPHGDFARFIAESGRKVFGS